MAPAYDHHPSSAPTTARSSPTTSTRPLTISPPSFARITLHANGARRRGHASRRARLLQPHVAFTPPDPRQRRPFNGTEPNPFHSSRMDDHEKNNQNRGRVAKIGIEETEHCIAGRCYIDSRPARTPASAVEADSDAAAAHGQDRTTDLARAHEGSERVTRQRHRDRARSRFTEERKVALLPRSVAEPRTSNRDCDAAAAPAAQLQVIA